MYVENATWGSTYIASLMIEKYLHDTIAKDRKPIEERMAKANLIEKFLANRPVVRPLPTPVPRDTLPRPEGLSPATCRPVGTSSSGRLARAKKIASGNLSPPF